MSDLVFNVICGTILLGSFLVVFSRDPIIAIISLISVFICTAFLFLLFKLDFLAYSIVIIYVGAISILFIFVIMMLNLRLRNNNKRRRSALRMAGVIAAGSLLQMGLLAGKDIRQLREVTYIDFSTLVDARSQIELIGVYLTEIAPYALIGCGFLLLLAVITCIELLAADPE
jgi:NADH-quinone oxidoreductase subunit J